MGENRVLVEEASEENGGIGQADRGSSTRAFRVSSYWA